MESNVLLKLIFKRAQHQQILRKKVIDILFVVRREEEVMLRLVGADEMVGLRELGVYEREMVDGRCHS